jgi:hypothetical protein
LCWGSETDGATNAPAGAFVAVSAGFRHTCGIKSDGSVACWGYNSAGEVTPPAGIILKQ